MKILNKITISIVFLLFMISSSFASLSPQFISYEFVGENPSPSDPDDICFNWSIDSDESFGTVEIAASFFYKNGTFIFEDYSSILEGSSPAFDCYSAFADQSQEVPLENISNLDVEFFLYNEEREKSFQYPRVDIVKGPLSNFNGTCEIKDDYNPTILCADSNVIVKSDLELENYLQNFGFDGNNFRNLKIAYDIINLNAQIHSPCNIILKDGIQIDGNLICLDGKKGIINKERIKITGNDAFIFSELGDVKLGKNSVINLSNMYVQATNKVRIGRNSTVNIKNILTLNSTGFNKSSNSRINKNSTVNVDKLFMTAFRKILIGKSTNIFSLRDTNLVSRGNLSNSNVKINKLSEINAGSLSINSGNKIVFGFGSKLNTNNISINN